MKAIYHLETLERSPKEYEERVFRGVDEEALQRKGMGSIRLLGIFLKDDKGQIKGGLTGSTLYGSLYVDMLWIDASIRSQGWGAKLMHEAEKVGKERDCTFVIVHTMDWQALPFYQNLGYFIEFIREGYAKDSKMYLLRKELS